MAVQTYNLGVVTAYGDARAGGYTGTLEEWRELMANYATVSEQAAQSARDAQSSANLAQQRADSITNLVAVAQTLPKESSATANYADGVLTLGIPRGDGDKGDKGDKGDVGPAPTVTITRITGGHRLTITDDTGDHSCDIMDGTGVVNDVLVNGNSVLTSGIANIPVASSSTYGVVKRQTTEQQDRNITTAIFGNSAYILKNVGSELAATSISSTEIQITDGQLIAEGYTLGIDSGTTESLTIEPGSSGMLRTDLIVARYTKASRTGAEDMQLVVIKGTPAASNPATPTYNTGSIANGDSPVDFPIYQVNINGTSITSVDALVDVVSVPGMVEEVQNGVDAIVTRTDKFYVFRFPSISTNDDLAAIGAALQSILSRGLGDITFVCYIFRAGAWQLNGFGSVRSGDARATFVNGYNGQINVVSRSTTSTLTVIRTL